MDENQPDPGIAESAPTTSRRSGRSARVELITRSERRRVWTLEQKREIVTESFGPDLTPTEVARKYAISSGQLYTWRHELLSMQSALLTRARPRFAQVEVVPAPALSPSAPSSTGEAEQVPAQTPPSTPAAASTWIAGLMEITLASGVVLRVDAHVDGGALRRVLDALERR